MFKTIKKITSCFLALCMLLTIAPMGVFATETIDYDYVSIGASNVNGYGLAGYFTDAARLAVETAPLASKTDVKMSGNVFGYKRKPEGSYPSLVADYLGSNVNHHQLAISSMRVEELRVLLDNTYYGDEYTEWRFTGGANWFNNALSGGLNALRADYQNKIAEAELVTVDIGANNFGVFLSRYITSGVDNSISVSDISPEIGDTYAVAKEYVLNLMEEQGISVDADIEEIVEILTYALVGYCYNFDVVMEKIYALNPNVDVVVVSIQNLMEGKSIKVPGSEETIPFGDLIGSLVNAANLYTAGISPYADKYTYVDVRKNGHVNFFADQLLAWDGTSELDSDIIDCFNIYDNYLYVNARLEEELYPSHPEWDANDANKVRALNAAYNTTAKIMKAGLEIDTYDFAGYVGANTSAIEGVLLENIKDEIFASVIAEFDAISNNRDSEYVFDANRIFEDDLFVANGISSDLVKTVAGFAIYTGIGNSFFSHPSRAGHNEIYTAIVDAIENGTKGKDVIADEINILIREFNELIEEYGPNAVERIYAYLENEGYIEQLKTAINELLADLENPDSDLSQKLVAETDKLLAILEAETGEELPSGEEVITAIRNYEETLADIEEYIANNEEIQEDIAKIENIIAQINDIIANPEAYIQNVIDDVVAKYEENLDAATSADYTTCGENHYVAFAGTNTSGVEDYEYSYKFRDYIDVTDASTHYFTEGTPIADAVDYIESLDATAKADLESATIVTYQTDAKNIVLPVFDLSPVTIDDWATLLNVDSSRVEEIKATIIAALKGEYAEYATDVSNAAIKADEIKNSILEKLPADWADVLTAEAQNAEIDAVVESILNTVIAGLSGSIDATLVGAIDSYAEEIVFNTVAYLINNIKAVETIKAINPDALIAVVGLHNPVKGLKFNIDGQIIDLGEYVDYFIEATNAYNAVYAMSAENVIFVEADETEIAGYSDIIAINTTDLGTLGLVVANIKGILETGTVVTENGHNYILNQLKTAITKVDHIDADNNDICDKCGANLAPVTPTPNPTPNPNPGPGGSGGNVVRITITFNTNGGSKIDSAKVAEGKTLIAPKAPVKEGYIFDGWYTDSNLTQKYNFSTPVTKAFTLYAKWIESEKIGLKFTDIKNDAWYYDVVKTIVEKGLMNGISETEFAPEMEVTRAMFVTILYRAAGEPAVSEAASFADVSADKYYAKAVAWANANGIVNGITESEFAPDNNITREQMAAILYRYAKNETVAGEITYTDKAAISDYALDAINWAYAAGIMTGNEDGSFAPLRNSSRAEAAAVFVRLLG